MSSNSAKQFKWAYVLFVNGYEKIVPLDSVESITKSKNANDFRALHKYKVWWSGKKNKRVYLHNAYILLLAGDGFYIHLDIWESMKWKNDFKFVREVADELWGRATLQGKYLDFQRANRNTGNSGNQEIVGSSYRL
ncbi:uncharacterized protein LOC117177672 [Belonocnema kinseyi]|uniref:uncharacterized protein LOC117177672 n=1 Tax=Belonocnema kinseyi TaxID=2817044 RepID=UPI00143D5167|nr:uncharacterized protein LOC117177672 [Belonocnema kinseyi]